MRMTLLLNCDLGERGVAHQTDDKLFNRGAMKNIAAEQAFKDTINAKVGDALETKRKEVANTFVKSTKVEEDGEEV